MQRFLNQHPRILLHLHLQRCSLTWFDCFLPLAAFLASAPNKMWYVAFYLTAFFQPHLLRSCRLVPLSPREFATYLYLRIGVLYPLLVLLLLPLSVIINQFDERPYAVVLLDCTLAPLTLHIGLCMSLSLLLFANKIRASRPERGIVLLALACGTIGLFILACVPVEVESFLPERWSKLSFYPGLLLASSAVAAVAGFVRRVDLLSVSADRRDWERGEGGDSGGNIKFTPLWKSFAQLFAGSVVGHIIFYGLSHGALSYTPSTALQWYLYLSFLFVLHMSMLLWCAKTVPALRLLPMSRHTLPVLLLLCWFLLLSPAIFLALALSEPLEGQFLTILCTYQALFPLTLALYLVLPPYYPQVLVMLPFFLLAYFPAPEPVILLPIALMVMLIGMLALYEVLLKYHPRHLYYEAG